VAYDKFNICMRTHVRACTRARVMNSTGRRRRILLWDEIHATTLKQKNSSTYFSNNLSQFFVIVREKKINKKRPPAQPESKIVAMHDWMIDDEDVTRTGIAHQSRRPVSGRSRRTIWNEACSYSARISINSQYIVTLCTSLIAHLTTHITHHIANSRIVGA
jgi:hypothetical protein